MSCPDSETLAAFIEGALHGEERDALVAHLADCGGCRDVFAGAVEFQSQPTRAASVSPLPPASRRWLGAAAVLLLAVLAGVVANQSPRVDNNNIGALLHDFGARQRTAPRLPLPWENLRGPGRDGSSSAEYRIGVIATDIQLATSDQAAEERLAAIGRQLRSLDFTEDLATRALDLAQSDSAGERRMSLLADVEARLSSDHYELGRAVRLAELAIASGEHDLAERVLASAIRLAVNLTPEEKTIVQRQLASAEVDGANAVATRLLRQLAR